MWRNGTTREGLAGARLLVLLWLSVAVPAAAAEAPLAPPDPECGRIGVSVHVQQGLAKLKVAARSVYLVRLEEDGDPLRASEVVAADHANQGRLYVLNARPGRYAAVACGHHGVPGHRGLCTFYFSEELIRASQVTVGPGEFAFLGRVLVKTGLRSSNIKRADPAQAHYFELIQPLAARMKPFKRSVANIYPALAFPHRAHTGPAEEREFWRQARDVDFAGEEAWQGLVDRHLEALAGP